MDFVRERRPVSLALVGGRGHYESVVERVMNAERSVWIATANLKELMVEDHVARPGRRRRMVAGAAKGRSYRSILSVFAEQVVRGVEIRILHASVPSGPFAAERARHPELAGALLTSRKEPGKEPGKEQARTRTRVRTKVVPAPVARPRGSFETRLCPRVHFKAVVVDGAEVYLGSANWTGAGLGAKGEGRRNFELGVISRDDLLLDEVQSYFDQLWRGAGCRGCKLRQHCPQPLDGGTPTSRLLKPRSGRVG